MNKDPLSGDALFFWRAVSHGLPPASHCTGHPVDEAPYDSDLWRRPLSTMATDGDGDDDDDDDDDTNDDIDDDGANDGDVDDDNDDDDDDADDVDDKQVDQCVKTHLAPGLSKLAPRWPMRGSRSFF